MTVFDCLDPVSRRDGMDAATTAARGGRLVVLPTDTVYGIGADAFSPHAVRDLLAAKGRGPDMPVPVLIGSTATLAGLVVSVPPRARLLMDAFWPGGLSLILEHAPSLSWNLGDTRNTVMVRMPLHPIALELLRAVGPMAVSSANISGRPPATTAEQAQSQLSDSVSVFLDAGPSPVGVASTVVDLTGETPTVRRIGAVSVEQLRAVLPEIEVPAELRPADEAPGEAAGPEDAGAGRLPIPDPDLPGDTDQAGSDGSESPDVADGPDTDRPVATVPDLQQTEVQTPDPAVSDRAVSDPEVPDPAVSDLAVSDPAVSDPAVSDPAVSDRAVSDPEVPDREVPDAGGPAVELPPVEVPDRQQAGAGSPSVVPDEPLHGSSPVEAVAPWLRAAPEPADPPVGTPADDPTERPGTDRF